MICMKRITLPDLTLSLAFLVFLALPLLGTCWSGGNTAEANTEKRDLAPFPSWPGDVASVLKLPGRMDAFATDNFGGRSFLLKSYKYVLANVFHQSASERSLIGEGGWLYVTDSGSLDDMQGIDPYTGTDITKFIRHISSRGDFLAAAHIKFGYVAMPDKHTVYPQHLPVGVYGGFGRRRLGDLDAAMISAGKDYYVDLSKDMLRLAEHSVWPLYYKSDTHWNPYGAYQGYESLVRARGDFLGLQPVRYDFDQFQVPGHSAGGDLALMSGDYPSDPDIYPPVDLPCSQQRPWNLPRDLLAALRLPTSHLFMTECPGGRGVALVLHDSFMQSMYPYVSRNYARAYYIWGYSNDGVFARLVNEVHPDIVLTERVERLMHSVPSTDMNALQQGLGLVGDRAKLNAKGELVIESRLKKATRPAVSSHVSIDSVQYKSDHWVISGWGEMEGRPPAAVIAVANDIVVAQASVNGKRGDVAATLHQPQLGYSGFALNLPRTAMPADRAQLQIYLLTFGTYSEPPVSAVVWKRAHQTPD